MRRLATASLLCLTAVGCTSNAPEQASESTSTTAITSTTTTLEPGNRLLALSLGHDRLGPVQVGMTVEQAERAIGEDVIEVQSGSGCATYGPVSSPQAIEFRVVDGRIIVIQAVGVETDAGIAVGHTEEAIRQAYASETVTNVNSLGHRRVVVRPAADSDHATVFILESGGLVVRIRAGTYPRAVEYEEGCP